MLKRVGGGGAFTMKSIEGVFRIHKVKKKYPPPPPNFRKAQVLWKYLTCLKMLFSNANISYCKHGYHFISFYVFLHFTTLSLLTYHNMPFSAPIYPVWNFNRTYNAYGNGKWACHLFDRVTLTITQVTLMDSKRVVWPWEKKIPN